MERSRLSRRRLLAGGGAGAALVALDALVVEPRWLDVSEHEVPVPGLPRGLDGFRIAHVTDAHLTELGVVEQTILQELRGREVQLVALTGDMIDRVARLPLLTEFCAELRAPGRTVVATLGNWEHWGRVPLTDLHEAYAAANVQLLRNAATRVDGALGLVATDDSTAGLVDLPSALRGRSSAPATLLLTHSPELLDRVPAEAHFDLALAGHTHGGQVRLGPLVPLRPPGSGRFTAGWYDVPSGRAYVSRGTGTSVVPARFTCRPELPVFTLRSG